jgi:hypothetical protein
MTKGTSTRQLAEFWCLFGGIMKLTRYEKETILLTSEGDAVWEVFTFNPGLKRRLAEFGKKYPDYCSLLWASPSGGATYRVAKGRLSVHLTPPYSNQRKERARITAKEIIRNTHSSK